MFLHAGKPISVRNGPQAKNQKIKFEGVRMMIEAMGNNDPFLPEINLIHFPCQEVHAAQHFADRIHNCREIQIAGRDFVKHWREQKKVLTIDKCDFDRRIKGKFPLQFHGHREAGKTSAYNEYPLWYFVFHEPFLPVLVLLSGWVQFIRIFDYQPRMPSLDLMPYPVRSMNAASTSS